MHISDLEFVNVVDLCIYHAFLIIFMKHGNIVRLVF